LHAGGHRFDPVHLHQHVSGVRFQVLSEALETLNVKPGEGFAKLFDNRIGIARKKK
jgi:hypothetical protein